MHNETECTWENKYMVCSLYYIIKLDNWQLLILRCGFPVDVTLSLQLFLQNIKI